MKKIKQMKSLLISIFTTVYILLFVLSSSYSQIPYNGRYKSEVFDNISVINDVVYGNAPALNFPYLNEGNTTPQDLLMDIYLPADDTLQYRPVIICAHSGAFVSGSKDADDMVAFCDSLAHRGYVAASIDYRLGMNVLSSSSSIRAVYRGIQDGRAAVRFLKEKRNEYGIDTNNIYILGSSAGAFIALHNLFMDTEAERPAETYSNPDLGCLDCSGNNYSYSGKSNGIISLWGALKDTSFIISSDTIPVFTVHGTADATVPFGYGSPFGNSAFPATYGSSLIADQLATFGNMPEKYFVFGADHEFYGTLNGNWNPAPNSYWDTVFNKTVDFIYNIHKPDAGFYITQFENVVLTTDTSKNAVSWYWDFGDGSFSTEQNPIHEYQYSGAYRLTQFVTNNLISWDTVSQFIDITIGISEHKADCVSLFPNPVSNLLTIKTSITPVKIKIFDSYGHIVVKQFSQQNNTETINTSNWNSGIYLLFIKPPENITEIIKFVKQ